MFDVGFSELLVIAVVALLVLGPERLPKAARFAGLWVRRARAQWNSVKAEFEHDLADDELRRSLRDTQASLQDARDALRQAGSNLHRDLESTHDALMRGPIPAPLAAPPAIEVNPAMPPERMDAPLDAAAPDAFAFDPDAEPSMHAPLPDPPPPSDAEEQGEPDAPQR